MLVFALSYKHFGNTLLYWRYKILPSFLLASTSFQEKIFEYGNVSSLKLLTVSENIYCIFIKQKLDCYCSIFTIVWSYYCYYLLLLKFFATRCCSSPIFLLISHRSCFCTLPMTSWGLS